MGQHAFETVKAVLIGLMPKHVAVRIEHILGAKRGAAMVEYALLAALIAVVASLAVTNLGTGLRAKFSTISNAV